MKEFIKSLWLIVLAMILTVLSTITLVVGATILMLALKVWEPQIINVITALILMTLYLWANSFEEFMY